MTWSELTNGPRITKEQLQSQLAQYPKSNVLKVIKRRMKKRVTFRCLPGSLNMLAAVEPEQGRVFDTTNLRKEWQRACAACGLDTLNAG
jgi:hypothetical protein